MTTKIEAILSLRPNAEWHMIGNDVSKIVWETPDVEPLTEAEVNAEMVRLESVAVSAAEAVVSARTSAMSKLAALGLSEAEVLAIVGGI
jgi:hypothetical protein